MNFKYFFALSFFVLPQAVTLEIEKTDITEEFCCVTQTPDTICAQLQVFLQISRFTDNKKIFKQEVQIKRKNDQKEIGTISFEQQKFEKTDPDYPDYILKIRELEVEPGSQKQGYGSKLLNYTLSQYCGSTCDGAYLVAHAFRAPESQRIVELEKLKKFYKKHGGEELPVPSREIPRDDPTRAKFAFKEKK